MSALVLAGALCEVVGFAATAWIIGMTLTAYQRLPARIANHFNLRGEPVQWSPRAIAWLTPVLSAVFFVLQTVFNPLIAPSMRGKIDAPPGLWMPLTLTAGICMLAVIQHEMLAVSLGAGCANMRLILPACGVLLIAVVGAVVQAVLSAGNAP